MRASALFVMLAGLCACDGAGPTAAPSAASTPATPSAAATPAPAAAPTGSVEGTVVLAEGAELPRRPDPKKSSKFVITDPPAPCSPIGEGDASPVRRDVASGGLSFIHVALTGMKSTAPAAPRTHELLLEDCRLNQSLLAARLGDSVRIKNASNTPLLPTLPGDTFMEAILAGGERTVELKRLGLSQMSCGFAAYCGQTDVLVTSHSLFAVTDKLGHFRIEGVPLDTDLTINAWHPLFTVSKQPVRLTAAAPTQSLKLVLAPTPPEVTPPTKQVPEARKPAPKASKKSRDPADLLQ